MWEVQDLLQKGMDALSQAEVASALQVYFNLGELTEVGPPLRHDVVLPVCCILSTLVINCRCAVL